MLKNYFIIAWRNFRKYKLITFINILGLSLGLAFSILTYLWIRDELSYDHFHPQAEHIFRITNRVRNSFTISTPSLLGQKLKEEIPHIVEATETQFSGNEIFIKKGDEIFTEDGFLHVSPSFLKIFHFPLTQGLDSLALNRPNTVVISEEIAKKYFPGKSAVGERLIMQNGKEYEVTGVLAPMDKNSSLQFKFLASASSLSTPETGNWEKGLGITYVLTHHGYDETQLLSDIQALLKHHNAPDDVWEFSITPLTDIHLYSDMKFAKTEGVQGDIRYVYIFVCIGVLILLIACINYINLSTSRSVERAKEVGIRKAAGAMKQQLIMQFMYESFLMVFFSLVLGFLLAVFLLPSLNALSGKTMVLNLLQDASLLIACMLLIPAVSILAGLYPSYVLTSFNPVKVLKGSWIPSQTGKATLRQMLVVFQFTASVMLITGTLIIWQQLNLIKEARLGFSKEQIISINARHHSIRNYSYIKDELMKISGVEGVSSAPMLSFNNAWYNKSDSTDKEFTLYGFNVDDDFLDLLEVEVEQGRPFHKNSAYDLQHAVILNQAAVEMLELDQPLGSKIESMVKTDSGNFAFQEKEVIGILGADVHFQSLKSGALPLVMQLSENNLSNILIKISSEDIASTVDKIQKVWKKLEVDFPFDYTFLDDTYDQLYQQDRQIGRVFLILAMAAIFIAGLGLLGLSAYTVRKKTKEIGIRKVLGASVSSILLLLSKDYIKLIFTALVIAIPIANYFITDWLENFAYRIEVQWWMFVIPGLLVLLIALLSVSGQTWKAARQNPVESLKYE